MLLALLIPGPNALVAAIGLYRVGKNFGHRDVEAVVYACLCLLIPPAGFLLLGATAIAYVGAPIAGAAPDVAPGAPATD